MPSNHLILCRPLLLLPSIFPSIEVFSNEPAILIDSQTIGASLSASVFPMNIQASFSLGLTGLISLLSKGLSRVFTRWRGSYGKHENEFGWPWDRQQPLAHKQKGNEDLHPTINQEYDHLINNPNEFESGFFC